MHLNMEMCVRFCKSPSHADLCLVDLHDLSSCSFTWQLPNRTCQPLLPFFPSSAAVAKRRPDENCIRRKLNSLIIAFHIDAKYRLSHAGQTAVSLLLDP